MMTSSSSVESTYTHTLPDSTYLPYIMSQPFDELSQLLQFPVDQLRLVFCFVLALPLGQIHKNLPTTTSKHIYSIICGICYTYLVCGYSSIHLLLCSTACYITIRVYPQQPIISTIIGMLYLSISHIYRLYVDYLGWSLDYTMCLMVLIVKTSTLAYNVSDGIQLRKIHGTDKKLHKRNDLHEFRVSHSIPYIPSPLQFYSYIYYYAGVLVGPAFEFREYIEYTDMTMFYKDGLNTVPSTIIPSLNCVCRALLCYIGIYLSTIFPVMGYINTVQYTSKSNTFLYKAMYMFVSVTVVRFKYYFAWLMAEAGTISTGLAYNGINKSNHQIQWNRVSNVHIIAVETATNFSIITNNWNLGTNNWLKHYIYFRVSNNKSIANLVTKLVSAFWHGFYSGYYLMFGTAWLINEADTIIQTVLSKYFYSISPHHKHHKLYYSTAHQYIWISLTWLWSQCALNYIASAFVLLRARWGIAAWGSIYYSMHIVAITIIILGKFIQLSQNKPDGRKQISTVGKDNSSEVVPQQEHKYELRSKQN